ncbi:MAG: SMP-30/gluconolactonase/LRE family protein [Bacteroidales bacterium]|nr:SMP-30/gluconolactonase/LRE family protein [Bacteroidales bacterium]
MVITLIISCCICYGQFNGNINFQNLSIEQGLSNSHVNAIFQDSKGFLWIATYMGLNRYDGYEFEKFIYIENDSTSLSHSAIFCVFEDSGGDIWVGTLSGLNKYNGATHSFVRFIHNPNANSISNNNVRKIIEDNDSLLWIATYGGGINSFNKKTGEFHCFKSDREDPGSLTSDRVNTIFIDSKNTFWVGSEGGGISIFNREKEEFNNLYKTKDLGLLSTAYIINNIFEDSNGRIWFCSWFQGLLCYNTETNEVIDFKNDPNNINSLSHNTIRDIIQDKDGILWIAAYGGGLNKLNVQKNKITRYEHDPSDYYSISNNKIWCVNIDNSDVLWLGTYGNGVSFFDINKQKFRHYNKTGKSTNNLNSNEVSSFCEIDNKLWIGTVGGGVNVLDLDTDKFRYIKFQEKGLTNNVASILQDKAGRIWIGTADGLIKYNPDNGNYILYQNDPSNENSIGYRSVYALHEDNDGNMWISIFGNCVNVLEYNESLKSDSRNAVFKKYLPGKNAALSSINTIRTDKENNIWLASAEGLLKYIAEKDTFINEVNYNLLCFYINNNGTFWLGTGGSGLIKINPYTKETETYTILNGIPNNTVVGIVEDNQNNIWIGTEGGLARFDQEKSIFTNYTRKDGLQANEFIFNSCIKLKNGMLAFGGNNGFNLFDPAELKPNLQKPKVAITKLKILNKEIHPGDIVNEKKILDQPIFNTDHITLSYRENTISFEFSAFSYNDPIKNQYRYKLENFDKDWFFTNGKSRSATYTNLPGGEYVFRVIASNSDGIWNNDGDFIKLTILPPFWKTFLFKAITVIILILIIVLIFYLRTRSIRLQNEELERQVQSRTEELSNKNDLLKTQTDNLNEVNSLLEERQQRIEEQSEELKSSNESLAEANAMKDKFFSIIAHDLKNPFNSVLGFIELLEIKFKQWPDEKKINIIKLIRESSQNVYSLLENLLQWSRSQRGVLELNYNDFNLNDLIKQVISHIEPQATSKKIEIAFQPDKDNIIVSADMKMIETVVRNLLSNAVKFTEQNKHIELILVDKGDNIEVSVKDEGIGIDAEAIPKLFDIDNKYTRQGTNYETSTGFGLVLCKEFIEDHKGRIWVTSKINIGSIFTFSLPRKGKHASN